MRELLADRPVLLLFVLLAIGTAVGAVRLGRLSLGPAGVLFTALAFSAWDERLAMPEVVGTLGLALFAYAIGVTAGPSFFASLSSGLRPVTMVAGALAGLGVVTWGLGVALGLDVGSIAGLYAGATTNTPALAAALVQLDGAPQPTVAYSLSYIGGVLVMLLAATWAMRSGEKRPTPDDRTTPSQVHNTTILVTHDNALEVRELTFTPYGRVIFSRCQGADGTVRMVDGSTVLRPGGPCARHRRRGVPAAHHQAAGPPLRPAPVGVAHPGRLPTDRPVAAALLRTYRRRPGALGALRRQGYARPEGRPGLPRLRRLRAAGR